MTEPTQMSIPGRRFLERLEAVSLVVYKDPVGLPTIGVGHLLTRDERSSGKIIIDGEPVRYSPSLTAEQVDKLLAQDLDPVENNVVDVVRIPLTQYRFDALCSFSFNTGQHAFNTSTLLKRLNLGDLSGAIDQFGRWVYAGGQRLDGLVRRRKLEARLFAEGLYE